jgi:hypothetical protein
MSTEYIKKQTGDPPILRRHKKADRGDPHTDICNIKKEIIGDLDTHTQDIHTETQEI